MDFGDDDFESLIDEAELLQDCSQASLTDTTANLDPAEPSPFRRGTDAECFEFDRSEGCSRPAEDSKDVGMTELRSHAKYFFHCSFHCAQELIKRSPAAIAKIEDVFEQIVDALLNEKEEFSITLKSRKSAALRAAGDGQLSVRERRLCFPGKNAEQAWRFCEYYQ